MVSWVSSNSHQSHLHLPLTVVILTCVCVPSRVVPFIIVVPVVVELVNYKEAATKCWCVCMHVVHREAA